MNSWHDDLLNLMVTPTPSPESLFFSIEQIAQKLGFKYVAYGYQAPYPVTQPKITLLNNYPVSWRRHYKKAGYLNTDPIVMHAKRSQNPLLWGDEVFAKNPELWKDAQEHGIRIGWAQSCLESNGSGSLLTLCRCHEPLTLDELQIKEPHMRWLVQVAHVTLSRAILAKDTNIPKPLTSREREVLQWTADGKSAQDIADILSLSKSTVDFHLANSIKKLNSPNKTAAVASAVLSGWLR